MGKHKQIGVRINGALVKIDVAIAPLIRALNKCHIKTLESCQGDSEHDAWVGFTSPDDPLKWLPIAGSVFQDLAPYLLGAVGDSASLSVRLKPSRIFLGELSIRPGQVNAVTEAIKYGLKVGELG